MKFQLSDCVGMRLRRLSSVVDAKYRQLVKGVGITENQLSILFVVSNFNTIEQGKIGKILRVERSTVSRAIKLLENKCLLCKTEEYQPEVELTTEGKALVKRMVPLWEGLMDELYCKLEDKGMKDLSYLEHRLL